MSAGTEKRSENSEPRSDPYALLMAACREADKLGISPGRGKAAWILTQYRDRMPGEGQVIFGGPYTAGCYTCDDCGAEPSNRQGVRVLLPTDRGGGAVLAGPFCAGCAVRLLKGALA